MIRRYATVPLLELLLACRFYSRTFCCSSDSTFKRTQTPRENQQSPPSTTLTRIHLQLQQLRNSNNFSSQPKTPYVNRTLNKMVNVKKTSSINSSIFMSPHLPIYLSIYLPVYLPICSYYTLTQLEQMYLNVQINTHSSLHFFFCPHPVPNVSHVVRCCFLLDVSVASLVACSLLFRSDWSDLT